MTAPVSPTTTDHLVEAVRNAETLIAAAAAYPQCEAAEIIRSTRILETWFDSFPTDPDDVEAVAHCVTRAAGIVAALAAQFSPELSAIADRMAAHVRDLIRQRAVVS